MSKKNTENLIVLNTKRRFEFQMTKSLTSREDKDRLLTWKVVINWSNLYMNSIGKIAGCILLGVSVSSHAGLWATTAHSRANCFNNESITWYAGHSYYWRVISFHSYDYNNPKKGYHYIDTGMGYTWRQAAVHWNESAPGGTYFVSGFHYYEDRGRELLDVNTTASDCSIYDGWWD